MYPFNIIYISGLPKSGTTWLERMLASMPGFNSMMFPGMHFWGFKTGGSHDYELNGDLFDKLGKTLSVIKSHSHGSPNNVNILHEHEIRYVIMYRDIRDVGVSHVHFVRQRPWHPEYEKYSSLSIHDGLLFFAENMSSIFADWIRSWSKRRDPEASIVVRYEQMRSDSYGVFKKVLDHYQIQYSDQKINDILKAYQESNIKLRSTHFRKGIIGDWKNHFSPIIKDAFKENIGEFLIEFGYEQDMDW